MARWPDLGELDPWKVSYPSDGRELAGYFFPTEGDEPGPAIVVNHGSAGASRKMGNVVNELHRMGYAVFLPIRRGFHDNPGQIPRSAATAPSGTREWDDQIADALREECDDVMAALEWLRSQPSINADRVGMIGVSSGGVMTMLAIGRTNRLKAAISFAALAMNWDRARSAREAVLDAVRCSETPLFLIQAQNDYGLAATYAIGAELARLGKTHETRIYASTGGDQEDGHSLFVNHVSTWVMDAHRFLERWLPVP
jgi:dienelactone hydrolase